MNKTFLKVVAIFIFTIFCISCNHKENTSGIIANARELKYDKLVIKLNKDTLKGNEVNLGKELILNIYGLRGFKETFGKLFLGCNLVLTDASGKEIIIYKDLYSYYDVSGISTEDIKNKFSISLNLQAPMKRGETYTWKSRIWDKKGAGEINTELTFKIK